MLLAHIVAAFGRLRLFAEDVLRVSAEVERIRREAARRHPQSTIERMAPSRR